MVTIKDIAQQAGVSFSTVSKALRDSPLVQPRTKAHIFEIARQMGYQPNLAARSLVSKRTGVIGLVWPSIERAALSTLITGLNEELEQAGYTALVSMSGIETAIETFHRFQVDGIVVFGDKDGEAAPLNIRSPQIPILTYGAAGYTPFSTVDVNRGQAIRLAVRHLAALGHRQIAFIGEPEMHDPLQAVKIEAFKDEAAHAGLHLGHDDVIRMKGLDYHDGFLAARTALNRPDAPTAVISAGIDLTRGILRAVSERGLSVPRNLSVVSYDNLPQMEDLEVPMTAVGVAIETVASSLASALLELIETPDAHKTVHLEPELVIRASTSAPNAN